jgi:imidazolonepropionase
MYFAEKGFFSVEEMIRVCEAGAKYGLKPKLHVNQLSSIGGVEAGIKVGAVSLDHLETMTERDIQLLSESDTIGTLLPTAAFFLVCNINLQGK